MKIAVVANDTTYTYNLRGALIRELTSRSDDVLFIGRVLLFSDELTELGCRLINLDVRRHGKSPVRDIGLLNSYMRILGEERPDAVLSFNIKPNVYGGIACRRLKIRFIPNITGLGTALEYPGALQVLTKALYKAGIAEAECVFFQNRENQKFFTDNRLISGKSRMVLLPGSGVDIRRFPPLPYPQGEQTHFLFVSRILEEKGIDLYLAAAKEITHRHPETVFHICGYCDDARYQELLSTAQTAGYIRYHGEQKSMRLFYELAGCVIHPSYYPEGMSNVLLEAAASARPVITTCRSGCAETVDDARTGYLIPIKDQQALVDAIERFLRLTPAERRDMGLRGRAKMEREFDRHLVTEQYLRALYREEPVAEEGSMKLGL